MLDRFDPIATVKVPGSAHSGKIYIVIRYIVNR
jgi:hypothetical protein